MADMTPERLAEIKLHLVARRLDCAVDEGLELIAEIERLEAVVKQLRDDPPIFYGPF